MLTGVPLPSIAASPRLVRVRTRRPLPSLVTVEATFSPIGTPKAFRGVSSIGGPHGEVTWKEALAAGPPVTWTPAPYGPSSISSNSSALSLAGNPVSASHSSLAVRGTPRPERSPAPRQPATSGDFDLDGEHRGDAEEDGLFPAHF